MLTIPCSIYIFENLSTVISLVRNMFQTFLFFTSSTQNAPHIENNSVDKSQLTSSMHQNIRYSHKNSLFLKGFVINEEMA